MKSLLIAWIVICTWTAHWNQIVPCPLNEADKNPYTGNINFQAKLIISCMQSRQKEMTLKFKSLKEYRNFKAGCPSQASVQSGGYWCSDWKIEKK